MRKNKELFGCNVYKQFMYCNPFQDRCVSRVGWVVEIPLFWNLIVCVCVIDKFV